MPGVGGGGFSGRLELKLKLAWEQAHLWQLGVGRPPAYLTHSSWRLTLPAPLPKLPLIKAISKLV